MTDWIKLAGVGGGAVERMSFIGGGVMKVLKKKSQFM